MRPRCNKQIVWPQKVSLAPHGLTDANLTQALKLDTIINNISTLDHVDVPIALASACASAGDGESLADLQEIGETAHIITLPVSHEKVNTAMC